MDIAVTHKKVGEDRTRNSEDMLADRQTDRHGHHNTLLPRARAGGEQ